MAKGCEGCYHWRQSPKIHTKNTDYHDHGYSCNYALDMGCPRGIPADECAREKIFYKSSAEYAVILKSHRDKRFAWQQKQREAKRG